MGRRLDGIPEGSRIPDKQMNNATVRKPEGVWARRQALVSEFRRITDNYVGSPFAPPLPLPPSSSPSSRSLCSFVRLFCTQPSVFTVSSGGRGRGKGGKGGFRGEIISGIEVSYSSWNANAKARLEETLSSPECERKTKEWPRCKTISSARDIFSGWVSALALADAERGVRSSSGQSGE